MTNQTHDHDFSLQAVPKDYRKGFLSMLAVMLGFTFFSASMWTGGTLGTGLHIKDFIITVLLGNLILGVYASLLAYAASKTGLSTHLLARYAFGEKGSYLASGILGITQVGWFGVGVAMFAIPVQKITGINVYTLIFVSGILMTSTAYFGIKTLTILSIIAVPSISILGGFSVLKAVETVGGISGLLAIEPKETIALGTALTMCVGSFISGGTLTPDFARFSKNKKISVCTTLIAFFIGNSLMFIFGAVGAAVTGQADISEVMFLQGLILPAIIILGFNIWTTNDNALYASGLGFSNITKLPKNKLVIFNGIIGTAGAMFLYNNFVGWLNFLSSFIPAIGGIIIADYYLINKGEYEDIKEKSFESINYKAIATWVIGVVAARFLPGIAPLNAVLTSLACYVLLHKLTPAAADKKKDVSINA
ncbi:cytosine permease [Geosporobacter ferrireducens]|uniref:Cytosine permease n=1 Tax=Geosporobacter ferrireducens TaxID=1424294 RepID=A0A1D8GNN7_9FIRM|nr:cytosine permease [Geosporobacter ferrireducens]AOT72494.1 cytosine permease [Geosporobacter ferrireducens]MTI58210.1 cytosine permease [Geosporobacter ferrireducens]